MAALAVNLRGACFLFRLLFIALIAFTAYEIYSGYGYYTDLREGTRSLERVQDQLSFSNLTRGEQEVLGLRAELALASEQFRSARDGLNKDPGLKLASLVPDADRQADAVLALVAATDELIRGGLEASDVFLAFLRSQQGSQPTLERGQDFLRAQQERITRVRAYLAEAKSQRAKIEGELLPPIEDAKSELDRTLVLIDMLVSEYELVSRADSG